MPEVIISQKQGVTLHPLHQCITLSMGYHPLKIQSKQFKHGVVAHPEFP
jgi:hypothetical protein